jgi:hypothetical protein
MANQTRTHRVGQMPFASASNARGAQHVETRLCIPDDQLHEAADLPVWALELPDGAPLPRTGDVLYLSSTSAWGVSMVIHERLTRDFTRIEVWLSHVGASRHSREPGSSLQ